MAAKHFETQFLKSDQLDNTTDSNFGKKKLIPPVKTYKLVFSGIITLLTHKVWSGLLKFKGMAEFAFCVWLDSHTPRK